MTNKVTVLAARWVIPVEPYDEVLSDHSVVIEDSRIIEVMPTASAQKKYPSALLEHYPHHVLLPGLINAHTHTAMSLLRGYADDVPLMRWLNDHIWPAEQKWVSAEFVRDGSELAIAEMLMGGTTCFSDMYFFPDITALVAQDHGIRAVVGTPIFDFPSVWGSGPDEYFEKGLAVHDECRALSRVSTALAPHAPFTVADDALKKARTYADELNIPLHMHIHETSGEISESVEQFGVRPLDRLNELGLLNPRMIAVHMTQLLESEIELVANLGVHVVHCPSSNAKLASGYCPAFELLQAGANVCLGTDSAASNNRLDMFSEMRLAAMLAKLNSLNATALNAHQVIRMATINGAVALNIAEDVGSLVAGKAADIIAVDLNRIATQPVYDPAAQLVYSASSEQVSDVWVNGKQRLQNGELLEIELNSLLQRTKAWNDKIASSQSHQTH